MNLLKTNRLWIFLSGFFVGLTAGWLIYGATLSVALPMLNEGAGLTVKFEKDKDNVRDSLKPSYLKSEQAKITSVIDGDTVQISTGESIRLLAIDAAERGEPCFDEAKNTLLNLIGESKVTLIQGKENKDKYDRLLRWIFLDDQNINLALVGLGLARARISKELEFKDELIKAENQARQNKLGCLWQNDSKNNFTGLDEISIEEATDYFGETVNVTGTIDHIFKSVKGNIFINFCANYKTCPFSAVIFSTDQHRFEHLPDETWVGKEVIILGEVEEYKNQAEIIISKPEQIILSP